MSVDLSKQRTLEVLRRKVDEAWQALNRSEGERYWTLSVLYHTLRWAEELVQRGGVESDSFTLRIGAKAGGGLEINSVPWPSDEPREA